MALPPIILTDHAVERYRDRVREVGRQCAREQLSRLLNSTATIHSEPPTHTPVASEGAPPFAWLWFGDDGDLFAPLVRSPNGTLAAVTLYVRGGISLGDRKRRNAYRAYGRQSKRGMPKRALQHPARPRAEPQADEW